MLPFRWGILIGVVLLIAYTNGAAIDQSSVDDDAELTPLTDLERTKRSYNRGQTQSQYLNFGTPEQDGKAEAEANEGGSRSHVDLVQECHQEQDGKHNQAPVASLEVLSPVMEAKQELEGSLVSVINPALIIVSQVLELNQAMDLSEVILAMELSQVLVVSLELVQVSLATELKLEQVSLATELKPEQEVSLAMEHNRVLVVSLELVQVSLATELKLEQVSLATELKLEQEVSLSMELSQVLVVSLEVVQVGLAWELKGSPELVSPEQTPVVPAMEFCQEQKDSQDMEANQELADSLELVEVNLELVQVSQATELKPVQEDSQAMELKTELVNFQEVEVVSPDTDRSRE
ncbi:hypothetical protein ACLKA7_015190 [Drosophila subpalustris]